MANVEIISKETCPYCHRAKALLSSKGVTSRNSRSMAMPPSVKR